MYIFLLLAYSCWLRNRRLPVWWVEKHKTLICMCVCVPKGSDHSILLSNVTTCKAISVYRLVNARLGLGFSSTSSIIARTNMNQHKKTQIYLCRWPLICVYVCMYVFDTHFVIGIAVGSIKYTHMHTYHDNIIDWHSCEQLFPICALCVWFDLRKTLEKLLENFVNNFLYTLCCYYIGN